MTTSNTPSVVSSSPSSGQLEFNTHTSDVEDDGAERNTAYRSNKVDITIFSVLWAPVISILPAELCLNYVYHILDRDLSAHT